MGKKGVQSARLRDDEVAYLLTLLLETVVGRDPSSESNQVPYRDEFWLDVAAKMNTHFQRVVVQDGEALGLRKLWYEKKGWYMAKLKELNVTGQAGMSVVLQAITDIEERTEEKFFKKKPEYTKHMFTAIAEILQLENRTKGLYVDDTRGAARAAAAVPY